MAARRIYEALKDFYRYVVNNIKGGEDLSKLSLSELIDRTNKEISGGKWLKELEKDKSNDGVSEGIPMFNIKQYSEQYGKKSDFNKDGTLKEEVRKEIEAERNSIVEKAKADGTYMKAPNGEKSNLSEEQWVTVRTKRFKDWFGDWEAEAENNFNFTKNRFHYGYNRDKTRLDNRGTMESSTLNSVVGKQPQRTGIQQTLNANHRSGSDRTGSPVEQAKRFSEGVEKFARENGVWNNDAINEFTTGKQIGQGGESEVYLSKDGKKAIKITHLTYFTDAEDLVWKIAAHNRLFELDAYNIIGFAKDKDGRVSVIQEQPYVKATQKATQKQIDDFFIKNGWKKKGEGVFEIGEFRISDALIKEDNDNVLIDNENNLRFIDTFIVPTKQVTHIVSKVIDENGEPLVVWHATNDEITTFTRKKSKEGFYFSAQKDRLGVYNKRNYIPAFLNIKNPIPDIFVSDEKQQEYEKKGYDGKMDFGHTKNKIVENLYEIVAFSPNQIKSATSNVGTFSNESNDINFSVKEQTSADVLKVEKIINNVLKEEPETESKSIAEKNTQKITQDETEKGGNTTRHSAVSEAQKATSGQQEATNKILNFLQRTIAYFERGENIVLEAEKFAEGVNDILKVKGIVATIRRTVNSISEAQKAIEHLVNKPLTNKKLGITGTISKNSLEKIGTLKDGEDARLHAMAVANIDALFESSQFDVTHADEKGRREVQKVHRLGSLMLDSKKGEYVPVMTTVIEYNKDGNRIYSVEAVDVETIKSAGQLVAGEQSSAQQTPIADFNTKIAKLLEGVKSNPFRFAANEGNPTLKELGINPDDVKTRQDFIRILENSQLRLTCNS